MTTSPKCYAGTGEETGRYSNGMLPRVPKRAGTLWLLNNTPLSRSSSLFAKTFRGEKTTKTEGSIGTGTFNANVIPQLLKVSKRCTIVHQILERTV